MKKKCSKDYKTYTKLQNCWDISIFIASLCVLTFIWVNYGGHPLPPESVLLGLYEIDGGMGF